jgi:class 3 adenylate cyclase
MNVADWLRQIGLEQYIQLFAEHDISAEVLPHLTADDLKDLGIAVVGHRRRLLVAIEALRGTATPDDTRAPGSGSASERRQITVLFCDIVGSTPLSTQLDPEEFRDLLSAFQLTVTAAVTATGGYVARVIGDGLLVYFGCPMPTRRTPRAPSEGAWQSSTRPARTICRSGLALRAALS